MVSVQNAIYLTPPIKFRATKLAAKLSTRCQLRCSCCGEIGSDRRGKTRQKTTDLLVTEPLLYRKRSESYTLVVLNEFYFYQLEFIFVNRKWFFAIVLFRARGRLRHPYPYSKMRRRAIIVT